MFKIAFISVSLLCILNYAPTVFAPCANAAVDSELAQIDSELVKKPNSLSLLLKKANRLGDLQRFKEELVVSKTMIAQYPEKRYGYYTMMQAEQGLGNNAAALFALDRTMKIGPIKESDYLLRCSLLYQNGRHAEALIDAERAIRSYPDIASSYFVRANCYYQLHGACQQVIADLNKVKQLDPSNAAVKPLLAKIEGELARKKN
jgi:tetratricopeptide (TPR) repeat protein